MLIDHPDNRTAPQAAASEEIELQAGQNRLRVRGTDMVALGTLVMAILAAFFLYQHMAEAKEGTHELIAAMKEQTIAIRESTCLLRFPESERPRQADFCKQISR